MFYADLIAQNTSDRVEYAVYVKYPEVRTMLMRNHNIVLLFSLLLILAVGCQGSDSPTSPGTDKTPGLSGSKSGNPENNYSLSDGHQLIALLKCEVDWESETISYEFLRSAEQHLNLLQLIPIYCHPVSECLDFKNIVIDFDNLIIELDVIVKHPIPDPYADVYDMRGIGIFKSNEDPGFSGGPIATQMLNADGYTTAYDEDSFYDAFLNPYIAFNKDKDHRIFKNNTTSTEHVIVHFPSFEPEDSQFLYALDATWSDPLFYDPDDPLTDPNMAEPYEVRILHADPIADQYLAEGTVIVQVFDWQANADSCEIDSPDLLGGNYTMAEVWSNDGVYMYYFNLVNDLDVPEGSYKILVKANDEFESQQDLVNPNITVELTNYQLGSVEVYDSATNTAPVVAVVTSGTVIQPFTSVHFDASDSWDAEDGSDLDLAWDLDGDGLFDDSSAKVLDWVYNDIGTYPVNVIATDSGGLSDVLSSPIIINVTTISNTPPVAAAEASKSDPLVDEVITLDASASTDAEDGKPASWNWDLDNDEVYDDASGEIINYSWSAPGVYFVDVLVKDSGFLGDTLNNKLVIEVLQDTNQPPTASATASQMSAVVGEEITFDGSGSTDPEEGKPVQWRWDLYGNESYSDASGEIITHKYWSPGVYDVDLKVFDSKGLWDTLDTKLSITITGEANTPPVAEAVADKLVVNQFESIHFDATASFDAEDGDIEIFAWDLNGDGGYFEAFSGEVDYYYPNAGFYLVDVRVTDSKGATDTLDEKLLVQVMPGDNTPPIAVATADKDYIFEGDSVTFDGSGSTDLEDGIPTSWQWDLDNDGDYDDSPFVVASKQFNTAGVYYVDLKVTDSGGFWDTLDEKLTINVLEIGSNLPPEAKAEISCTVPMVGQTVYLTDMSTDGDGTIVQWEWDFGDGSGWQDFTSTQGNATYAPAAVGQLQFDLRVTDNDGLTDKLNSKFSVIAYDPLLNIFPGNPNCPVAATYVLAGSTPLDLVNTSIDNRDLAFLNNSTFIMVISGSLYHVMPPSFTIQPPLMDDASWVKSIDTHSNGTVALSNLDDGIIKLYQATGEMEVTLTPMKDIDTGQPIQAVCFDNSGNLWAYMSGTLMKFPQPSFAASSCNTFYPEGIEALGTVNDMDYSAWNQSLFIAIADGANGTVARVSYLGDTMDSISNVLDGPSDYLDIVCDKNVPNAALAGCRIVVVGGQDTGYMTRLNAKLSILGHKATGYWGIRAIALDSGMSNTIVGLESCCLGWIDLFIPPPDWHDAGD